MLSHSFQLGVQSPLFSAPQQKYPEAKNVSLNLALGFSEFSLKMANPSDQKIYEFGGFRLDAGHLMLSRDGSEIQLARSTSGILVTEKRF